MATNVSVSGGASQRHHAIPVSLDQHKDCNGEDSADGRTSPGKGKGSKAPPARARGAGAGQSGTTILAACFVVACLVYVMAPPGLFSAAKHRTQSQQAHQTRRDLPKPVSLSQQHQREVVEPRQGGEDEQPDDAEEGAERDDSGVGAGGQDGKAAAAAAAGDEGKGPDGGGGGGVALEIEEIEPDELIELRESVEKGRSGGGGGGVADTAEGGDEEDGEEGGEREDLPPGAQRGNWRWTGDVWRRIRPKADPEGGGLDGEEREEISWWERRTVQDRLPFDKYINCPRIKEERERPTLEGLPMHMKWKVDDYIVHQGNYITLKKGPEQDRTQKIRNPQKLPLDGLSVLDNPGQWGSCAVVGNSGVLRLTELSRAIESHKTVIRINQAPTYGYSRRVGRKVTHRVLNRLWTRTYRNTGGVKKGQTLPIEKDLTFMVARASSQEYELFVDYIDELRPDVNVWYLSSRATTGPTPLLMNYRERLCKAGFGPYKGLNVPSSGFVAIQMLLPLCDRVTVYGFGVEGMLAKKMETPEAFGYHYYKGVGSRHVGDDVHCFDCEEKVLQQMGAEGHIDFCTFEPNNATNSWACGCRHEDLELCRPPPRPTWLRESDSCDPGFDDCEEVKAERLQRLADRERGKRRAEEEPQQRGSASKASASSARKSRPKKPLSQQQRSLMDLRSSSTAGSAAAAR